MASECIWVTDPNFDTVLVYISPVEGVGLCDGSVQSAGCPVTDQLEQKHHTVTCILGDCQVHTFPWLCGDLDDRVTYSVEGEKVKESGVMWPNLIYLQSQVQVS